MYSHAHYLMLIYYLIDMLHVIPYNIQNYLHKGINENCALHCFLKVSHTLELISAILIYIVQSSQFIHKQYMQG